MQTPIIDPSDLTSLWDNFRRDVNHNLTKIDRSSLNKRYGVFNYPPYKDVQAILEKTGKWLCKAAMAYLISENKTDLKNFDFYFWPGYETWRKRQRIFISGSPINNRRNQKNYFTGIGAKRIIDIKNPDEFKKFLLGQSHQTYRPHSASGEEKNEEEISEFIEFEGDSFFYRDNPSTYAFDQVLNPLNLRDKHLNYTPGSTHIWKASQTDETRRFIPLRLADNTELRVLHVSVSDKHDVIYGQGLLSILVPEKDITVAGNFISRALSLQNIPLFFFDKYHSGRFKGNYVPWPSTPISRDFHSLQVNAYSFWIAETMSRAPINDYTKLKKRISSIEGFEFLADRLQPFEEFCEKNPEANKFQNTRFEHWYTMYFESFSSQVDLGSSTLMSSDNLHSSGFLKDATNQIRWLFQELRILEVNAQIEWDRSWQDVTILRHSQRHYIQASNAILQKTSAEDFDTVKSTLSYCNDLLNGYLDISKIISNPEEYVRNQKINDEHETVKLGSICKDHLRVFLAIIDNDVIRESTIRHKSSASSYYVPKVAPLIQRCLNNMDDDYEIKAPEYVISLVIKELIINALENIDFTNPIFNITIVKKEDEYEFRIQNSVPRKVVLDNRANYEKIAFGDALDNKKLGWRVIIALLDALRYKFKSTSFERLKESKLFTFQFFIPIK